MGSDYSKAALAQIPRALTLLDRNPASPTYGCFDRSWWLDRATDFPNALAQYVIHGLALVWAYPMKENPYYQKPVVREWGLAGLSFLVGQAHSDGSFDEFYPNERGWSGPSGFLLYAMLSAYETFQVDPHSELGRSVREVAERCAWMHVQRVERGTLANHYAMAFLPVAKARRIFGDENLKAPLERRFQDLLKLQDPEGWFQEYDGPDLGYLSAMVSFLAKMEREGFHHPGLRPAVEKALQFLAYFLWPDGTFGGALGSRQTVHLYPHGLEYYAKVFPIAASLAKAARRGFAQGGFVPPAIQSDRYYHYRINELLEASLQAAPLPPGGPAVPYDRKPFSLFFPRAGIKVVKTQNYYAAVNLRKGGVLRAYELPSGKAAAMDSGMEVQMKDGTVAAANWVNPRYEIEAKDDGAGVRGKLSRIPFKNFTSGRFILFRLVILTLGVFPQAAERLKGLFRKLLTLGIRETDFEFERRFQFGKDRIEWQDRLVLGKTPLKGLWVGAELPLRYVPQSRHFQKSELDFKPLSPDPETLESARQKGAIRLTQTVSFPKAKREAKFEVE